MVPKEDRLEGRDGLGVWDGNAVKLGCDDHCTTINIMKFIELKAKKKKKTQKIYLFIFLALPRALGSSRAKDQTHTTAAT